ASITSGRASVAMSLSRASISRPNSASRTLPPTRYARCEASARRAASCWVGEPGSKKRARRGGTPFTTAHSGGSAAEWTSRSAGSGLFGRFLHRELLDHQTEVVWGGRGGERFAQLDEPLFVEAQQALVEGLHAVVLALGDDRLDLVGLVGPHDLVEH